MTPETIDAVYERCQRTTGDPVAAAVLVLAHVLTGDRGHTPDVMSVAEAAGQLGVSKETVYNLCADNVMPHTRIGRRITITSQQLEDYRKRPRFRHLAVR